MAKDIHEIFGTEYPGDTGIKAADDQDGTKVYIRPQGTVSTSENGTAAVLEYDADIFWDYENRTGHINYGTYDDLVRIINDGGEPKINVTLQYGEDNSDTRLALGIEISPRPDKEIWLYAGHTWNYIFTWSTSNEIICTD